MNRRNPTPEVDERGHTPARCDDPECNGCMFCVGGLDGCSVCGGLEGAMPTNCPGHRLTATQGDEVYAGRLDYRDGAWVAATSPWSLPGARLLKTVAEIQRVAAYDALHAEQEAGDR